MRVSSSVAPWVGLFLLACGHEAAPPAAAPEEPAAEPAPAAPPSFAAPAPAGEEAPRESRVLTKDEEGESLAAAEAEFEQARSELYAALAPAPSQGSAAGAAPPASRPAKPSDAASGGPAPKQNAEKKASSEGGCATACRAFDSLGRAASAVCRLAGDQDERCTRAKGIVSDAQRKVTSCGCRSQ